MASADQKPTSGGRSPPFHRVFTTQGYLLDKSKLSSQEKDKIYSDLEITPKQLNTKLPSKQSIIVFRESQTLISVPKFYGITNFGEPKYKIPNGSPIPEENLEFVGEPRDDQAEAIDQIADGIKKYNGGIIELPTGWGKTFVALWLIFNIGLKTLIVSNRRNIMQHWQGEIEEFMPKIRIGQLGGGKHDIDNVDIVVASLQTIALTDIPLEIFEEFGITIYDEIQTVPCQQFSKSFKKIVTKYMFGMSGSPERKDGMHELSYYYLGPKICSHFKEVQQDSRVVVYQVILNDIPGSDLYSKIITQKKSDVPDCTGMITLMSRNDERSKAILEIVRKLYELDKKILILSDRVDQLLYVNGLLRTFPEFEGEESIGLIVGSMTANALRDAKRQDIIIGTYQNCDTGMNCKQLNTEVLLTPRRDVLQIVGRILRKNHGTISPVIIDIVDPYHIFYAQANARRKFYDSRDYIVVRCSLQECIEKLKR